MRCAKRDKNEIGIHTVRGGTIVGEHEVIFAGRDEILRVSHSAMSKEIFATGSINAARFLAGRNPGSMTWAILSDSAHWAETVVYLRS
ncbi:MAG: dihydrodipicolinate reductase C-terminal domain-containing protein [Oscillospiraceae bacterium]